MSKKYTTDVAISLEQFRAQSLLIDLIKSIKMNISSEKKNIN